MIGGGNVVDAGRIIINHAWLEDFCSRGIKNKDHWLDAFDVKSAVIILRYLCYEKSDWSSC